MHYVVRFAVGLIIAQGCWQASLRAAPQASTGGGKKSETAGKKIAASVNGKEISQEFILQEMQKVAPNILQLRSQNPKQFQQIYASFLANYVGKEVLGREAEAHAEELLKDAKARDDLDRARKSVLLAALVARKTQEGVTQAALEKAFKEKGQQEMVAFSAIVFSTEAQAKGAIKLLKAGTHTFEKLAKEKSEDKESGKQGGKYPETLLGQLPAEMRMALMKLDSGGFTEVPVKISAPSGRSQASSTRWLVIKLRQKRKASFQEAEPALKNVVSAEVLKTFVSDVYKRHNVEIYDLNGKKLDTQQGLL